MKSNPKFRLEDPQTKEEKLIVELTKSLNETTHVFMQLNNPGVITHEVFLVLRDASIGYAGGMVRDLGKILSEKGQIDKFLDEAITIFNCYIEDLREQLK